METIKDNLFMITHTNKYVFHIVTTRGRTKSQSSQNKPYYSASQSKTILIKEGWEKGQAKWICISRSTSCEQWRVLIHHTRPLISTSAWNRNQANKKLKSKINCLDKNAESQINIDRKEVETTEQCKTINPVYVMTWFSNLVVLFCTNYHCQLSCVCYSRACLYMFLN